MTASQSRRPNLRPVALPAEHGGWGFLLEPLLLGLLVAPSLGGACLALAAIGAFLVHQPLKILVGDRRRGQRFALLYAAIATLGLLGALALSGPAPLVPILLAVPLAMVLLVYDVQNESRHWLPELAAPLALGSTSTAIALAGGWPAGPAIVLWIILAARAVPSILYVRTRIRLGKNQPATPARAIAAQGIGLVLVAGLALANRAPWLAAIAMLILLVRAAWGLSLFRRSVPAKVVGFQEIAYGLLTVLLTAVGFGL
jgi:uncharacterized membrane protein YecN with MAPEG domain